MPHKILISHATEDSSAASLIHQALEDGFTCSRWQPNSAQTVADSATSAVDKNDALVLIISAAMPDSMLVRSQVEHALASNKEIIPFRIDASPLPKHLEFYLSSAHWLETSTPPQPDDIRRLVSAVRHLMGLNQPRLTKKVIASIICGILGFFASGIILGPLAIILGGIELKSIAAGRSWERGRKYAWTGIALGFLALLGWTIMMIDWWYTGINPNEALFKWLQGP